LVAYACKVSFRRGGEGFVSFESKNLTDRPLCKNDWSISFWWTLNG